MRLLIAVIGALLGLPGLMSAPAAADDAGTVLDGRVAVGSAHSCEVLDNGAVRCWGLGADGRLGHDATDNIGDGIGPSVDEAGDVPVGGPVAAVTAGEAHTCALLAAGGVRCWGDGAAGRLGYDVNDDVGDGEGPSIEEAGDVPLPEAALAVAAGAAHTCALLESGAVSCWGDGSAPDSVEGVGDVVRVAAGGSHSCAVTGSGMVQCWEVGEPPTTVSTTDGAPAVAIAVGDDQGCAVLESGSVDCWELDRQGRPGTPRAMTLATGALTVAAGGNRACALLTVGAVQCWETGGAADGASVASGATALAVGPEHACALIDEQLACWGSGADGRLGYGDVQTRPVPAAAGAATPSASDQASPGQEVTFGGGSQADEDALRPPPSQDEPEGSRLPWLGLLAVPVAALGGWALWRRRWHATGSTGT